MLKLVAGALAAAVICLAGPEAEAKMGGMGHNGSGFGGSGCGGAGSLPIDCFRPDDYPEYYAPTYHVSRNKHVAWCKAHYRTYKVSTDKFTGRSGKLYRCNSPYDGRQ